jgi:hypothetical protein
MQSTTFKRNAAEVYLSLVPVAATFFAFVTGHVSPGVYLPIWGLNAILMIIAAWILGANAIIKNDVEKKHLALAACMLLFPTLLAFVFFGMGAPPDTAKDWVDTATEQQARFAILIIGGIAIAFGLVLLRETLKTTQGDFYAHLGLAAILVALPLFLFNMSFWHSFALETYKIKLVAPDKKLDWWVPAVGLVWALSIVEVSLFYVAIAAFAAALKSAGWFRKITSRIYIIISIIAIVSILLYPLYSFSSIFSGFPYYPFMIPAIPFFIIYFMGINLLRRAGNDG